MGDAGGGLCDNERSNGDDDNFMNLNQPSHLCVWTAEQQQLTRMVGSWTESQVERNQMQ